MQAQKSETKATKTAITTHHGARASSCKATFDASALSMATNAIKPKAPMIGSCAFTPRRHSFSSARLRRMKNLYPIRTVPATTITTAKRLIACKPSKGDNHAHPHNIALKSDIQVMAPMELMGLMGPLGLIGPIDLIGLIGLMGATAG